MEKPVLVIMAAGMGSRYGGLKQIDPIDAEGHMIIDFSIYDAKQAGFEKVVFIIKKENEQIFREKIGDRIAGHMEIAYAFQELNDLPEGFEVPEGRVKPWGTAHAVLAVRDIVHCPFAVINADDYYGRHAFEVIYQYLTTHRDDSLYRYTMVAYRLKNTVTENGSVARGVCTLNDAHELTAVTERTKIEQRPDGIAYTEDDGATWIPLPENTLVSMNMWGFTESILKEIRNGFPAFLKKGLEENPLKCEYFLPSVVTTLLEEHKSSVSVLESEDKWYGVTYREDKPTVVQAIQSMKDSGFYPVHLWD